LKVVPKYVAGTTARKPKPVVHASKTWCIGIGVQIVMTPDQITDELNATRAAVPPYNHKSLLGPGL
jgi:hypothetical protein